MTTRFLAVLIPLATTGSATAAHAEIVDTVLQPGPSPGCSSSHRTARVPWKASRAARSAQRPSSPPVPEDSQGGSRVG